MKSTPRPPMTLGNAAANHVSIIVWCKACQHQIEPDPAAMADRYGMDTPLLRPFECPAVRRSEVDALPRKMNARCQPRSLKKPTSGNLASGFAERDSRKFQPLEGMVGPRC